MCCGYEEIGRQRDRERGGWGGSRRERERGGKVLEEKALLNFGAANHLPIICYAAQVALTPSSLYSVHSVREEREAVEIEYV
jgi:hypothetical protein